MTAYPAPSVSFANEAGKGPIAVLFARNIGEDGHAHKIARDCAARTKPHIFPPKDRQSNSELPESFQSIGAIGTTTLEGKVLSAVMPPDQPLCELVLDADIRTSRAVSDEDKQKIEGALFLREILIQALLESAGVDSSTNRRPAGLRSQIRQVISHLTITGDALFRVTDDFRIIVYRRDQYVTRRDSAGDPLYHIVCETIDPLALSAEHFDKTGLDREEISRKPVAERMMPIFTKIEWKPESPETGYWHIEQEVNGRTINTSEERRTSPYISVPFDLTPPDHYGHAYVELLRGKLRTVDNLSERIVHHAALASENKWARDANSLVRDEDLQKPPGSVISGARVIDGKVQDVGLIKADNVADFSVVERVLDREEAALGRAFLMETETAPQGEAGRSPRSWERIALELEGGLGGLYSPINEYIILPLVRRVNDLIERKKLGPPLPPGTYQINLLTGLAALGRAAMGLRIQNFAATLQALGEDAASWIKPAVLVQVLARYNNIYVPGLVKTQEEKDAETQAAIAAQVKLAAGNKAADVVGNVAEAAFTPQGNS